MPRGGVILGGHLREDHILPHLTLYGKNGFSASAKSGLFWLLVTVELEQSAQDKQVLFLIVPFWDVTKVLCSHQARSQ
jgi:hypothetical protein